MKDGGHPTSPEIQPNSWGKVLRITRKGTLQFLWTHGQRADNNYVTRDSTCYGIPVDDSPALLNYPSRVLVTSIGWISKLQERLRRLKYCHASFQTHKLFYYQLKQKYHQLKKKNKRDRKVSFVKLPDVFTMTMFWNRLVFSDLLRLSKSPVCSMF